MTDKIVEMAYKGHTLESVSQTFRLSDEETVRIWKEWRSNQAWTKQQ